MSEPLTATEPQLDTGEMPVPMPKTIGRFTLLNEIGRGSYGVVYAAHDPVLAREVAIKIIPLAREETFRTQIEANFLQEAKSAGGMSHPSIVTIYDAGKTDSFAYIAMERLHGQDLHEYLAGGNRMSPRQAASMLMRLADAIHYANKRGLVHRDIKPSNIFLSRDLKPKLLDFGTALAPVRRDGAAKQSRHLVGTPNYMSPEQAKGESLDARSDIFSLGTILYELLAGRRAFDGRTIDDTLGQVVSASPRAIEKLRPEMPIGLTEIVRKAMARDPAQRYSKAADLRNALAEFVEGSRSANADLSVAMRPRTESASLRPGSSWRIALGVAAAAIALVIMIAALRAPRPAPVVAEIPLPSPVAAAPAPETPALPDSTVPVPVMEDLRPVDSKAGPRRRNEPAPAAPAPREGTVNLAIAPWGEVFIDGAARGVSPPLTQLVLPPGTHSIEVRNGTSPAFVARVDIRSGESLTLQHRF